VVIKPSFGLADGEIERMITDSYTQAASDKEARSLQESRVEARRIIEALESALAEDGRDLLSEEEYNSLKAGVAGLQAVLESTDTDVIQKTAEALNEASLVFAGRRMDTQIKSALAGHTLEEIDK